MPKLSKEFAEQDIIDCCERLLEHLMNVSNGKERSEQPVQKVVDEWIRKHRAKKLSK